MVLGLESGTETGPKFASLLMLVAKTIHHWDYTSVQHITQDWFVQLVLSGACGEQSLGLIFHSRQPAEAHVKYFPHSPGRELMQSRRSFPFTVNSRLINVCFFQRLSVQGNIKTEVQRTTDVHSDISVELINRKLCECFPDHREV